MRVLVVDDNRSSADALAKALGKLGDQTEAMYDGASAIRRIEQDPPDVVLTDLKMEPVGGMSVLRAARACRPPVDVIVFTAYGAIDTAVEAMRLGAHDFLTKPVTLEQVVTRLDALRKDDTRTVTVDDDVEFFAEAPPSRALLATLQRVATVPSQVLLEGEVGSGRGHAAWLLHRLSGSPDGFTTFDVGRDDPWPTSGTVVLPSVDDLPDDLQRELVRRLEHVPDGLRLVATSGPDGTRAVQEGRLRQELYFELAVIVIRVPPLRERPQDILPLLDAFLTKLAARYDRPVPVPSASARERLMAHAWPGNIRELANLAERAVVLGGDALELEPVRSSAATGIPDLSPGFSLAEYLEQVERAILVEALRLTDNDRSAAGRLLNVERNTLRYKLNKYGLL